MDKLAINTEVIVKDHKDHIPIGLIVGGYMELSHKKGKEQVFRYIVRIPIIGTTEKGEERLAKFTYLIGKLLSRLYVIDIEFLEVVNDSSRQEKRKVNKRSQERIEP